MTRAPRSGPPKRLWKKARRGFRGYPLATLVFYGPDDRVASKLAVAIIAGEDEEPVALERWWSQDGDIRDDRQVADEVLAFLESWGALSVVMAEGILGCPHEEGVDYEGPTCPMCPFWANRDRWTGKIVR